jgi:hypothetical protein
MRYIIIFAAKFKLKNMLQIIIPEDDMSLLKYWRYNHPHPRVMLKMEVLYLKGLEYSNEDICKITGICGNTMVAEPVEVCVNIGNTMSKEVLSD